MPRGGLLQIQGTHSTIGGSEGVTLGGPCMGACNVFASGLSLSAPFGEAGNHVVQGNFLGTDVSGSVALGLSSGIEIADTTDNLIGGTDPAERNLISGNASKGVLIANTSFRNQIVGNLIGTDASGTRPLPNGEEGVLCCGSGFGDDNTIERNVIAFNGSRGVVIFGGPTFETVGNAIRGNSIFANGGLGIDLSPGDGPTQNDAGDGDTGPNGLQNFPVITRVTVDGGETTIEGTLNSVPDSTYHVELFRNSGCDPSHFGEGETFLGSTSVTTGPSGDANFAVTYPVGLGPTEVVTSTATDARNNTSEFSECLADLSITKSDDPDPVAVGTPLTYTIDVANDGPAPASAVRVIDTLPSDVKVTSITSSQGSCDQSTVTCTLGSIGRGGAARITIIVDPGSTPRTLTNTAAVSSELRDPDESDNSATATTQVVAELPGTIIVRKVTVPSPGPDRHELRVSRPAAGSARPASASRTANRSTFADLVPRAGYSVAETTPAGWDLDERLQRRQPGLEHRPRARRDRHLHVHKHDGAGRSSSARQRSRAPTRRTRASLSRPAAGSARPASASRTANRARSPISSRRPATAWPRPRPPAGTSTSDLQTTAARSRTSTSGRARPSPARSRTRSAARRGAQDDVERGRRSEQDIQSFTFQLRQGASAISAPGRSSSRGTRNAGNGGVIDFATATRAGQTYKLCEIVMAGWIDDARGRRSTRSTTRAATTAPCCTQTSGLTRAAQHVRGRQLPPRADSPRTIGFWKNWASAAPNGNQAAGARSERLARRPASSWSRTSLSAALGDFTRTTASRRSGCSRQVEDQRGQEASRATPPSSSPPSCSPPASTSPPAQRPVQRRCSRRSTTRRRCSTPSTSPAHATTSARSRRTQRRRRRTASQPRSTATTTTTSAEAQRARRAIVLRVERPSSAFPGAARRFPAPAPREARG